MLPSSEGKKGEDLYSEVSTFSKKFSNLKTLCPCTGKHELHCLLLLRFLLNMGVIFRMI